VGVNVDPLGEGFMRVLPDGFCPLLAPAAALPALLPVPPVPSGLRLNECLLRWSEVNWEARRIEKLGKGSKRVSVPITDIIREILWPLRPS
jgi:hypothetical protein